MGEIVLRKYQAEGISLLRKEISGGKKRVILRLSTGAGKTALIGQVIKSAVGKGRHVLFLVHLRELVKQASAHLDRIGVGHGVIMAGEQTDHAQSVFVASIQTYNRRIELEDHFGDRLFKKRGDLIICDESHHCLSATYRKTLEQYPEAVIIGLTATPGRSDGQGLGDLFDSIVCPIEVGELIEQGYLVGADYYAPDKPDLDKIKIQAGDYNQKQLGKAMDKTVLVGNIYEHWNRLAVGKQTIIFAVNVAHSEHIRQTFQLQGVSCAHVDAHTPEEDRRELIGAFKAKEITVLTNVGIFTEGFDAPGIECVVLARPTKSLNLYLQMCLDQETEILTEQGWRGMGEIFPGDRVAALNLETGAGVWSPVKDTVLRRSGDNERFVSISSPRVNFRVTDQHDMVFSSRSLNKFRPWSKIKAAKLAEVGSGGYRIPSAVKIERPGVPLSDDELRFIGLFMTDGSRNKANNAITIYQSDRYPETLEFIEKTLAGCNFKFGKHRVNGDMCFGKKRELAVTHFYVSFGKPRGTQLDKRGWGSLLNFVSKDFSPALMGCNEHQTQVLLEAINHGDGRKGNGHNKKTGETWNRIGFSICSDNKTFAERLQALCVTNGMSVNITYSVNGRVNPIYEINTNPKDYRQVGGQGQKDRQTVKIEGHGQPEKVWCIETEHGTILTRRQGKVAVMGNCGRGLRPADGKDRLILIDHSGSIYEHGFLDEEHVWSLEGEAVTKDKAKKKDKEKSDKQHDCRQCKAVFKGTVCPQCGTGIAPDQKPYEAELIEVKTGAKVKMTAAEKQEFYSMALRYRQIKGYKPGYEAHTYRAKVGVWPRSLREIPKEPDHNFLQFIRHLQIKKAHGREANAV